MSKTHAPGPYEVVVVEDAQGKNGDKWILIRNEGGAIATVYPARDSKETANLLAAAPELLEALKLARAVAQDEMDRLTSLQAEGWNAGVDEAKVRFDKFDAAIVLAEKGREAV
jgi:hypothetical protein